MPGAVTGSEGIEPASCGTGLVPPRPVPARQDPPAPLPPPPRSLNRLFDAKASGTEKAVTAAAQLASSCLPASLRARWMQAASKSPPRAKSPGPNPPGCSAG